MRRVAAVFYPRILVGFVLALALIGLACGEEGEDGTSVAGTPAQQDEVADQEDGATNAPTADNRTDAVDGEDTVEPTVATGDGRVIIGDATHVFDVDLCELGAGGTEIDIRGQGTGPDGRPFTVRASRSGAIDIIQVRFSEGLTVFRAATGTSDALGGEAPSFEVDGRRVTTTATFYTPEEQERGPDATGLQGSFVVDCP